MFRSTLVLCGMLCVAAFSGGCTKEYVTHAVSGSVKFSDGSIPPGEIRVVRFEPVELGPKTKVASGEIGADGKFKLTTITPDDGAFPGEYKVTFSIFKTYTGREQLAAPQFTAAASTPITVKVPGDKYDFVIEKAP